jgi:hypothetical protein
MIGRPSGAAGAGLPADDAARPTAQVLRDVLIAELAHRRLQDRR